MKRENSWALDSAPPAMRGFCGVVSVYWVICKPSGPAMRCWKRVFQGIPAAASAAAPAACMLTPP